MTALSRTTGRMIDVNSAEHLSQSMADILTTPIGSRPMRRAYGSDLPDLVDQPDNGLTRIRIYAAAALALLRWEPRARLQRVQLVTDTPGRARLRLSGVRTDLPRRPAFSLELPLALPT